VVNVGAGTGNYEPDDRRVVAVEPSAGMIAKRPSTAAAAIRAAAEELPLKSAVESTDVVCEFLVGQRVVRS